MSQHQAVHKSIEVNLDQWRVGVIYAMCVY
jgi:hypothetical protein